MTSRPAPRRPVPKDTRKQVAARYGCTEGETLEVRCRWCPTRGTIEWIARQWDKKRCQQVPSRVVLHGLEWEHITPRATGGSNEHHNIALSCPTCNRQKSALTPQQWDQKQKQLLGKRVVVPSKRVVDKRETGRPAATIRAPTSGGRTASTVGLLATEGSAP